jgi:hypothetical protein
LYLITLNKPKNGRHYEQLGYFQINNTSMYIEFDASFRQFGLLISVNAHAENDDKQKDTNKSVRTVKVDYSEFSKEKVFTQGRYDTYLNTAQKNSLSALKQIPIETVKRLTREEVIALDKQKSIKALAEKQQTANAETSRVDYTEFVIFDASTRLIDDIDFDGYFQTFGLQFDADVLSSYPPQQARVYARLYLSRNQGPWELYYETDDFLIFDDSSDDFFEVITTLDLGYTSDHYDILIDLYEVGYTDIVASLSSDEIDTLFGLPLESANFDQYVEVQESTTEVIVGAASIPYVALLTLSALVFLRRMP